MAEADHQLAKGRLPRLIGVRQIGDAVFTLDGGVTHGRRWVGLPHFDPGCQVSEQLSLPGIAASRQPTDGVFFAIFPDAETAARIAELVRRLRGERELTGRPIAKDRFHLSLHHLGEFTGLPQGIVAAARQAAAAVAFPPFEVVFDRAMSFLGGPRSRPFVLRGGDGLAALQEFQRALGVEITKVGLPQNANARYTPHVTLLYDSRRIAEQVIEPVGWTVKEFVLVHSLLGRTRHILLARWPLRG